MKLFSKSKKVASTPFSEFIRNASSAEKKKVYTVVLKRATERQNRVIAERYRFLRHCVSNTDCASAVELDELLERIDDKDGAEYSDAFDSSIDAAELLAAKAEGE